jgi:superfamily II DNA/RNA helicase
MTNFSDLGLSPDVLRAVADTGYETATPIQEQAIPVVLQGRDVLGIAQTGTGKTAAFTLPMIDKLAAGRTKARMPRSLVMEPTRELADQVAVAFERYAKYHKLSWALLIGGVSFADQLAKLDRGVDVLIATPGRLLDHFERGKLLLTGVQILVVDEADRMLDMGFIPDIERIFKLTPPKKQTLFFSATMPPEITRLTKQFLNDPVRIEATRPAMTAETIAQHLVRIPSSEPGAKRAALRALMQRATVRNGIVFCNRKSEVDVVAKSLRKHGFDASPIHGDLDQSTRTKTLESFRKGTLTFLVASDVAARGLDIPDVSHVFNYDVPHHADDYVHRIGRTGRAGKSGEAFMIVTPADARSLDKVLKLTKSQPDEIVLDVDWGAIKSEGPRRDAKGGRGASARGRSGGRDRTPPVDPTREPASREPIAQPKASAPKAPRAEAEVEVEQPAAEPAVLTATSSFGSGEPAAPSESGGRERGGRRRGGRGRGRDRTDAPSDDAGAASADTAPAPLSSEDRRPERAPREAREPREARPAPERRPEPRTEAKPERGFGKGPPRASASRDDNDGGPSRFGSDTPAFLLRAAPIKKTPD